MIKIYRKRGVRAFDSRGKTILLTLGRMDVYMCMYFMNIYAHQFVALTSGWNKRWMQDIPDL